MAGMQKMRWSFFGKSPRLHGPVRWISSVPYVGILCAWLPGAKDRLIALPPLQLDIRKTCFF